MTHKSIAYFDVYRPAAETSKQARFLIRMAVACHAAGTAYNVSWESLGSRMKATLSAMGKIPMPKPFPRPPREVRVADWKPRPFEASYRLDAILDAKAGKRVAGFVVEHSSGLSLGKAGTSDTGELTSDHEPLENWGLIHTASGKGFGLCLRFQQAVNALMLAAPMCDWKLDVEDLAKQPNFQRSGLAVQAQFGDGKWARDDARRKLQALPVVELSVLKPVAAKPPVPRLHAVTMPNGQTRYIRLEEKKQTEAVVKAAKPAMMPVQLPNGRTLYVPDPVQAGA